MTKKTDKAVETSSDVQEVVMLTQEEAADRRRAAEREASGAEPSLEERQAMAEQATPQKRAEFYHTDHGYSVTVVDPDSPPKGEMHKRLEGLTERVLDLAKDGYAVFLESTDGQLVELDSKGRVKQPK